MSLLCNWFDDLGRSISNGLGNTWMIILICVFASISLLLLSNILRASINKTKIVFKWGQIILLVIFVLLTVWFCIII